MRSTQVAIILKQSSPYVCSSIGCILNVVSVIILSFIFSITIINQSYGMGIGPPQINSYLGEPLNVSIPLVLDSQEMARITDSDVYIGSPETFEKMGLAYEYSYSVLELNIEMRDKDAIVYISTERSFREPFVEFPLELIVGKNRLSRIVTLFLDPKPNEPISQVAKTTLSSAPASSVNTAIPLSATPTTSRDVFKGLDGDSYGPIDTSTTLGDIAETLEYKEVTFFQRMVTLWKANPDAFTRNHINGLKAGTILHIPNREEFSTYSPGEAKREVLNQYQADMKVPYVSNVVPSPKTTPAPPVKSESNISVDEVPAPAPNFTITTAPPVEKIPQEFRNAVNSLIESQIVLEKENSKLRAQIVMFEKQFAELSDLVMLNSTSLIIELEQAAEEGRLKESSSEIMESETVSVIPEKEIEIYKVEPPMEHSSTNEVIEQQPLEDISIYLLIAVLIIGLWFTFVRRIHSQRNDHKYSRYYRPSN